ncbi:hypothetical protein QN277_010354 [Acacia crassicarpa]|uniref:Uncharacterized protein n=1 Tax=Acacia crassicarpa TaxID=499986 RepID=A0AAE1JIB7_9FABA|nr:hypothetical protein QN277_010354 [Acacia crassicarpa]
MEPAKIDWKRLEWHFVEDEKYEHINAPKWVDFLAPDHSVDDEGWFCRSDCKHPRTVDDFLRSTPSKLLSSGDSPGNLPLGDQNRRDQKLKRRVPTLSSASPDGKLKFNHHNSENQDPDLVTPPSSSLFKSMKASIKSSEEKKKFIDDTSQHNKVPSLRSTLSAKNLFAGRPILSQITEFCNELKKLATRPKERENVENKSEVKSEEGEENQKGKTGSPAVVQPLEQSVKEENERKPFLELNKKSDERINKPKLQRKKRADENENTPILLNLENVRRKKDENLPQIRTNPPSPQCFSEIRGPNKTTPSKASKSRLMERGILQEVVLSKEEFAENNSRDMSIVDDDKEARALDVFWFLKPCTLSS